MFCNVAKILFFYNLTKLMGNQLTLFQFYNCSDTASWQIPIPKSSSNPVIPLCGVLQKEQQQHLMMQKMHLRARRRKSTKHQHSFPLSLGKAQGKVWCCFGFGTNRLFAKRLHSYLLICKCYGEPPITPTGDCCPLSQKAPLQLNTAPSPSVAERQVKVNSEMQCFCLKKQYSSKIQPIASATVCNVAPRTSAWLPKFSLQ